MASNSNSGSNFNDLYKINLTSTGNIQHRLRIVRVNNQQDFFAISKFAYNQDKKTYLPTRYQYFIPLDLWPALHLAFNLITPVADQLYRQNFKEKSIAHAAEAGRRGALCGPNRGGDQAGLGGGPIQSLLPRFSEFDSCSSNAPTTATTTIIPSLVPHTTTSISQSCSADAGTSLISSISKALNLQFPPMLPLDPNAQRGSATILKRPRGRPPKSNTQRAEETRLSRERAIGEEQLKDAVHSQKAEAEKTDVVDGFDANPVAQPEHTVVESGDTAEGWHSRIFDDDIKPDISTTLHSAGAGASNSKRARLWEPESVQSDSSSDRGMDLLFSSKFSSFNFIFDGFID